MALSTKTTNKSLPLAALGRLSVRDALNRGFVILDESFNSASVTLDADISGGGEAGDSLQDVLEDLTARVVALENA